jgi:hypothetical protein
VLGGSTKGYVHHPQLIRFKSQTSPRAAIAAYLWAVHAEAQTRGYNFDSRRIQGRSMRGHIDETNGQLSYEWGRLLKKLRARSPERFESLRTITVPDPHPLFEIIPGAMRFWEKPPQKSTEKGNLNSPKLHSNSC